MLSVAIELYAGNANRHVRLPLKPSREFDFKVRIPPFVFRVVNFDGSTFRYVASFDRLPRHVLISK
nr:hypothetical protein BDOA9_0144380 [Bradyrhizobium sp. DOA9]